MDLVMVWMDAVRLCLRCFPPSCGIGTDGRRTWKNKEGSVISRTGRSCKFQLKILTINILIIFVSKFNLRGTVAEWSKVLGLRVNKRSSKDLWFGPGLANLK